MIHLVIARYDENLDWLELIKNKVTYTIYNKGKNDISYTSIKRPNIGRESETYLHYIIDNYENLPDYICFIQGFPFDHIDYNYIEIGEYEFKKFSAKYNKEEFLNKIIYYNNTTPSFFGEVIECDEFGKPQESGTRGYNLNIFLKKINISEQEKFIFSPGANMIIPKKYILNYTKEWWINTYNVHNLIPLAPWMFERLWGVLFK